MVHIINGKQISEAVLKLVQRQIEYIKAHHRITPGIAFIQVGNNPASDIYVKNKIKKCKELDIYSFPVYLPDNIPQKHLEAKIEYLNNDLKTHGILIQLPLPHHINVSEITAMVAEEKDVDGFHFANIGKLAVGLDTIIPCTPLGCLILISSVLGKNLAGKKAVIIGRSNIVGKPLALLLLAHDCTVTILHSKSLNIPDEIRQADILVSAIGSPEFVKAEWVKPGAVVIDVGINRLANNKIVGDVDFASVSHVAKAITPVPGGVGPMTVACLMYNLVKAVCIQKEIELPANLDLLKNLI